MADRPIIFSAPMVRALLDGRKTQTRRLATSPLRRCEVGDRLWVRESGIHHSGVAGGAGDLFRHDVPITPERGEYWSRNNGGPGASYMLPACSRASALASANASVRPSIHMPRWASRLTLIVEDVRVERLQAISEADAQAEGVERGVHPITGDTGGWHDYSTIHGGPHKGKKHPHAIAPWKSAALSFQSLWETLHGEESWQANPFVVAVSFRVERGNIDTLAKEAA